MNIVRETPVDEGVVANLLDFVSGSTDWVFDRRLTQCRGNLLSACDEITSGLDITENTRLDNNHKQGKESCIIKINHGVAIPVSEVSKLKQEIGKADRWSEIFRLEQTLITRISDQSVIAELRRRRAELHKLSGNLQTHYQYEIKNLIDDESAHPDASRKLLFRLVKDMQWSELNSYHHHVFVCQLTHRVNMVFTLSMIVFFVVIMVMFSTWGVESIFLYLAMVTGVFGASFSMLISLEERVKVCDLDQLRSIRAWSSLLTRIIAGAGGGLLLYFFVLSGVITIDGLPPLDTLAQCNGECKTNNMEWGKSALFVLLAFVSGFIEKLIPGLIRTTGNKLAWADNANSESKP